MEFVENVDNGGNVLVKLEVFGMSILGIWVKNLMEFVENVDNGEIVLI
jgi:hypothetical protein